MKIGINFQPNILAIMNGFEEWHAVLEKHIAIAVEKSAGLIGDVAIGYMNWDNPTGALEESMSVVVLNPYEAYIGSNLPYAMRREWGFSGQTDSLGRFYPRDPGRHFMRLAIRDGNALFQVADVFITEVEHAWNEVFGSMPPGGYADVSVGAG